jgi:hypothetical protein
MSELDTLENAEALLKTALLNKPVALMDLKIPEYGNDPNEIIKNRFLFRGGICLMSGATGSGKSSFTMQWAIRLASGQEHFGLKVGDLYYRVGLKVLVIQAENDEGDLAEQREGVLRAIAQDDIELAAKNLSFSTMPDASGAAFADRLNALCAVYAPDVVFIDPVLAFLGGDNSAQKDVSGWVRNLVLPILMKHRCAAILLHHVNKPRAAKDQVQQGAYAMSGSAEWANAARCCLDLARVAGGVFKLEATKRGDRLWWKDELGNKTFVRYIAHHGGVDDDGRPIIAWRDALPSEIPSEDSGPGPKKKVTVKDVTRVLRPGEQATSGEIASRLMEITGCGRSACMDRMSEAVELGVMTVIKLKNKALYSNANQ